MQFKKILIASLALAMLYPADSFARKKKQKTENPPAYYGEAFEQFPNVNPTKIDALLKDKDELQGVSMYGVITEVCQNKGCWIRLQTNSNGSGEPIFVKFKKGLYVPKDLSGKHVIIHGNLLKKEQSVAQQQHFLEDAGATAEEIEKITEPKMVYTINATGLKFYNRVLR